MEAVAACLKADLPEAAGPIAKWTFLPQLIPPTKPDIIHKKSPKGKSTDCSCLSSKYSHVGLVSTLVHDRFSHQRQNTLQAALPAVASQTGKVSITSTFLGFA